MAALGLLGAFFGLAIVRLILFLVTIVAASPGIWLYPNLFEDVGFFDSFKPLWAWREVRPSSADSPSPLLFSMFHDLLTSVCCSHVDEGITRRQESSQEGTQTAEEEQGYHKCSRRCSSSSSYGCNFGGGRRPGPGVVGRGQIQWGGNDERRRRRGIAGAECTGGGNRGRRVNFQRCRKGTMYFALTISRALDNAGEAGAFPKIPKSPLQDHAVGYGVFSCTCRRLRLEALLGILSIIGATLAVVGW